MPRLSREDMEYVVAEVQGLQGTLRILAEDFEKKGAKTLLFRAQVAAKAVNRLSAAVMPAPPPTAEETMTSARNF